MLSSKNQQIAAATNSTVHSVHSSQSQRVWITNFLLLTLSTVVYCQLPCTAISIASAITLSVHNPPQQNIALVLKAIPQE